MLVDRDECIGCGECVPYCTMSAISMDAEGLAVVDQDECVECNSCLRAEICPTDAIVPPKEYTFGRMLRAHFSDPLGVHPQTGIAGRGTEEIKTNEVTGRLPHGWAGVALEFGRPGIGTRFRDVEMGAMALAKLGVRFEPKNPVTFLMTDKDAGKLRDDILDEKVLSAIIEFGVPMGQLPAVVDCMKEIAGQIDTVFSVDLACVVDGENEVPLEPLLAQLGLEPRSNGKTNVGLGRPLAKIWQEA